MAFNWAGAASGAQEGLRAIIEQQMMQQRLENEQRQMEEQAQYRQLQQEVMRQNAESLGDTRAARADEIRQRGEQRDQLVRGAQATLADPSQWPESQREFEVARAQHILRYGQDLPDAAKASHYGKPREPASKLLSPEEMAQKKELTDYGNRSAARFRPAGSTGGGARVAKWDTAKYGPGTLPSAVEQYIFSLRKKYISRDKKTGSLDDGYTRAREELMNKIPQLRQQGNWALNPAKALALLDRLYRKVAVEDYNEGYTPEPDEEDVPPMQ